MRTYGERLTAEIARADALLRLGRHAEVVDGLATLAGQYPPDERLAGQLMLALQGSGPAGEALAVYATVRARLADELGVNPGGALQRLHQRLLRADEVLPAESSTVPASPHRPPRPPSYRSGVAWYHASCRRAAAHFTGRTAHLRRLEQLLAGVPAAQPGALVMAVNRASGSRRAQALTLSQAANALHGLGRRDEALEHYALALQISRAIGDRQAEGWACHYLAEALYSADRSAEAGQYWQQAIDLFDAFGDPQAGDIRARLSGRS